LEQKRIRIYWSTIGINGIRLSVSSVISCIWIINPDIGPRLINVRKWQRGLGNGGNKVG